MPRLFSHDADPQVGDADDGRSASQAARQVAVAITLLMVSFLVLTRSHNALGSGAGAESSIKAGTVDLTDDDGGSSLFELEDLTPGDTVSNCIEVSFHGSVFNETVGLRTRGGGPLTEHLDTTIEMGTGGGFDSCADFVPSEVLFDGTLAGLHEQYGPSDPPLETFTVERAVDTRTFRITFVLDEDTETSGMDASTTFLWSVGA